MRARCAFEWRVFADATCAGLSVLIPVPLLDLAFEAIFRRRMPSAIARVRNVCLARHHARVLGGGGRWLTLDGCLLLPVVVAVWLVKRVSKKLVYILTVKEAAQQLSSYWHRAYLLDHVLRTGRLDEDQDRAVSLFTRTLDEADTDTLRGVAKQVAGSVRGVWQTLAGARDEGASASFLGLQRLVEPQWEHMQLQLSKTVDHFEVLWREPSTS